MTGRLRESDPTRIGPYRLLGRLGAGGMGVVYLGRSPGGRHVAVKTVLAQYADDEDFRRRFRREADLARRVEVRWIPPVLDADPDAASPWLATAYVSGPSVHDAVTEFGPLPLATGARLGMLLAEALEQTHVAGLVHRDIKPSNVLLALDGPRLIDFGIARTVTESTITAAGNIVGSPGFLSPEQARGERVGPASDVFSLGAVLAYALSGTPPFGRGTPAGLLYTVVHEEPCLEDLPKPLHPLVRACMAKAAQERPSSKDVRAALVRLGPREADDWLPAPVIRLIAARASALLDTDGTAPDTDGTAPDTDADSAAAADLTAGTGTRLGSAPADGAPTAVAGTAVLTGPVDDPLSAPAGRPPPPTRRRLLAVTGAASVTALGGLGLWAALRDSGGPGGGAPSRTRYVIGLHADLSGPGAAVGVAQERGARLAVARVTARTHLPFAFSLRALDDKGRPSTAREVADQLTSDPDVVAVIGPSTETTALETAATYAEAELATLIISAGAGDLTQRNPTSLVRITPDDYAQARAIVGWLARKAKARRVALVDDRTAYGWGVTRTVKEALRGETATRSWIVPAGRRDYGPVAKEILGDGADAVVYAGSHPDAARLAQALTRTGFTGTRIGTTRVHHPAFVERAGASADGWLLTSSVTDPTATPTLRGFAKDHQARFDTAPAPYAAEAFDAVHVIAAALTGSDSAPVERTTLIRFLRATTYQGVTKKLAFQHSDGDYTGHGTFLYRVEHGRARWLGNEADAIGTGAS